MEDVRILSLSATYSRPVNWRPHKKAKLMPGFAVIHQTCLYLFKPQDVFSTLQATDLFHYYFQTICSKPFRTNFPFKNNFSHFLRIRVNNYLHSE